jgi:NTE family protein
MNMHLINAEEEMLKLGAASKFNPSMDFLLHLRDIGRACAEAWLKVNWDAIGVESTIDIKKTFLG